jgi:hypothetical protein
MSNTISQPNNSFSPGVNPEMFSRPVDYSAVVSEATSGQDDYISYIAGPDVESQAVESGIPLTPIREGGGIQVNAFETVPSPEQTGLYADRDGHAIDPLHSEAALNAVEAVFQAASPEVVSAPSAIEQSQVYAPMVVSLRDRVLGTAEEN